MARSQAGRTVRLLIGLVISALGIWLTIQARLGVAPWEVLHIGLATIAGIGTASIATAAALVVVVAIAGCVQVSAPCSTW